MAGIKKYLDCSWFILIFLASVSLTLRSQTNDSFPVYQKLLGPGDLVFHVDSFKTKVTAASRSVKNIDELPVTIYVVSHDEILKNHYVTLADVLKSLPGVIVSQPGNGELGEIFFIRNLAGNYYTKILLNGMPVKPSVVSGMPIGGQLPVQQAERIEVVLGPSGSIYGADAASGVINIITKVAEQGTFACADIVFGQNEYTSMNYMIGGKAGKNKNLLQYSFYGNKTDFNNMNIKHAKEGYYNPLEHYQRKGRKFVIDDSLYSALDINENLLIQNGIQPSDFIADYYPVHYHGEVTQPDLTAELSSGSYLVGLDLKFRGIGLSYNNMYRRTHSSVGKSPYYYQYNDPLTYWGEKIQSLALSYNTSLGNKITTSSLFSTLSYRMDNNSSLALAFIPNTEKVYLYSASDDFLFEQIATYTPLLNLEILGGVSYQISSNMPKTNYLDEPFARNTYQPFGTTGFPNDSLMGQFGYHSFTFHNGSVFTQIYYVIKRFRIMGGIRYDINSYYRNNLNPRVAIMYRFPKTTFRLSYGEAIKAPPSSVAYESVAYPVAPDSIAYLVIPPDETLQPERFKAYEFSLEHKLFRRTDVEISVYYNTVSKLINLNTTIPVPSEYESIYDSVSTKSNDQDAESILFGGQLLLRRKDLIRKINLNAEVSLTYNASKSKDFSLLLDEISQNFNFTPRHYGQFRLSATPVKNLYIQFENTWMTQWLRLFTQQNVYKKVDGFYTIDLLINYKFGNNIQAFVKINNLLNEKYATPNAIASEMDMPSLPQPGRNIRFGLNYTLN